jgi:endonuclease/exonuclease/phosphatase family metal-dependent hydrolase
MLGRIGKAAPFALLAASLFLGAACGRRESGNALRPAPDEYSVMSYNLQHYSLEDRDGDGQRNDPKPLAERQVIAEIIDRADPDILIVQEIGRPTIFEEFRTALEQTGIEYPHVEYLRHGRYENNMALLSRLPIVARNSHTNDSYSIGEVVLRVARGIINVDIDIGNGHRLKVMAAHLKSKAYHPLGQTEMRRNEARILRQHIAAALKQDPECRLLVAGDLNDHPISAALRDIIELAEGPLIDLRPLDQSRTAWTHFSADYDIYSRIDYLLASPKLADEAVPSKCGLIDAATALQASDHRPLIAVFRKP